MRLDIHVYHHLESDNGLMRKIFDNTISIFKKLQNMATKEDVLAEFAKQNEAIANIGADIDRILAGSTGIPDDVLEAVKEQTAKLQALAAVVPDEPTEG